MNYIENLDYFLKYISEKDDYTYSHDIYRDLKDMYSAKDLTLTTDKLLLDNYIELKIDDSDDINKIKPPYYCRINYHGLRFLERGGYKSENKRIKLKSISTRAKIIANTLNAIIILAIGAFGVYVSYDSKKKDETINIKDNQIEKLSAKVDTLTNTIQDLKKHD